MMHLTFQAVIAIGLAVASLLVHGWLFVAGIRLPLPLEAWFTALPAMGVRWFMPTLAGGLLLSLLALSLQYLVLLRVAARLFDRMRRSRTPGGLGALARIRPPAMPPD